MSLLFNILEGGSNISVANRLGRRFVFWLGRMVADSRPGVSIHKTCLIHPEARICARGKQLEIGAGSIIARGTAIQGAVSTGEGLVVGAGSVVTKDIPPMSVAVGSPARVVKSRT